GVMVTIDTRLTNGPTGGPLANPTRNAALTTGSGAGRFRGLRSAASLKLVAIDTVIVDANKIPRTQIRGLIEASEAFDNWGWWRARFRGLRSAASLKPRLAAHGGRRRRGDSADSDPRPH